MTDEHTEPLDLDPEPQPSPDAMRLAAVNALAAITQATQELEKAQDHLFLLEVENQAGAIALIQDVKFRLSRVESQAATNLGKAVGPIQANLPDGRQFTLKRTQDRKEWDHEDWKRDARRAVVQAVIRDRDLAVMDLATGEVGDVALTDLLYEAVATAQEVHGSTAPRSTSLKGLGLYASDYCTSSPGGWKLNAIRPETKPETTTEKDA